MKKGIDYGSLVENLRDGVISIDESSHIVFVNKSAGELFGYPPLEMVGMSLTDLMPEKFRVQHRAGMKRFLETGEAKVIGKTVELEGLRKDGKIFQIELSISQALKIEKDYLFTALIRDISERKGIAEHLEKTNKNLTEKIEEMEKLHKVMMGREQRIVELKEKLEALKQKIPK